MIWINMKNILFLKATTGIFNHLIIQKLNIKIILTNIKKTNIFKFNLKQLFFQFKY